MNPTRLPTTTHHELRQNLLMAAVAYAHHRACWAVASGDERAAMDAARTRSHEAFIDACNILARAMRQSGEDASWRDELGDDRKRIGDFACHLTLDLSLKAR